MAYATANLTPRRNDGVKVAPGQSGEQRSGTWLYHSTADALATVRAAGYFSDAVTKKIEVGDDIIVTASDGSAVMKAVGYNGNTLHVVDQTHDLADVSWAVAAGAANICIMTGTIKNAKGETIEDVRNLMVYISEAATGIGVSADSYSTGSAISDGTGAELVADKVFLVQTGVDGVFAISITDTNKPADQYGVAILPNGDASVSAASAALWGA